MPLVKDLGCVEFDYFLAQICGLAVFLFASYTFAEPLLNKLLLRLFFVRFLPAVVPFVFDEGVALDASDDAAVVVGILDDY